MEALIATVFLASLMGSLHCAGMCGPFLAFAIHGDASHTFLTRFKLQAAYHLGRLVTYTLLGVAAGAVGALLNLGQTLVGLQHLATVVAGSMILGFGVITLLRIMGVSIGTLRPPKWMQRLVTASQRAAMLLDPLPRAAIIGLSTTFLPCGWLYAFAVSAAGTASPIVGGVVMAVFWVGTLPMMVSLGTGMQSLLGPIGRRMPALTSLALIAVGLYTLTGRATLDVHTLTRSPHVHHSTSAEHDDTTLCH